MLQSRVAGAMHFTLDGNRVFVYDPPRERRFVYSHISLAEFQNLCKQHAVKIVLFALVQQVYARTAERLHFDLHIITSYIYVSGFAPRFEVSER